MRIIAAAAALLCILGACERVGRRESPECDANSTAITDSSIGPLHIGEAAPALRVRCAAVLDTTVQVRLADRVDSASAMRMVVVGTPVTILHAGNRVTSLRVDAPPFQTSDSVGVGTSVARFRNEPGVRVQRDSLTGDVTLFHRARCGMHFLLSGWGSPTLPMPDDPPLTGSSLAAWPDSIVVRRVVVTGCRGRGGDPRVDSISEHMADSARAADSLVAAPLPNILTPTPQPPTLAPLPTPAAPATKSAATVARGDTGSITATARELAELKSTLMIPVQRITRARLRNTYDEARGGRVHEAIDIIAARGTPVLSATDGRLLKLFSSRPGGLMIYAGDASERFILMYGHLERYADGLKEGMPLKRGQVIGYVGTTGNAPLNTPHLHFAIARGRPRLAWWRGTPVNPYPLLAE